MSDSQFNVERATNGFVLTLFLAAALFLGIMLLNVLRDMDERASEAEASSSSSVLLVPDAPPAVGLHASADRVDASTLRMV